jgi:hypothetical protein
MSKQRDRLLQKMDDQKRLLEKRNSEQFKRDFVSETNGRLDMSVTLGKLSIVNDHVRVHKRAFEKIRLVAGLSKESEILER